MVKVRAMRTLENALRRYGFQRIAGVDEVAPGCLAGPVVAAAVVLDPERYIPGIHDSKTVTALERERLYTVITRKALAWSVAAAQPAEIDVMNIHRASLEAMRRAVMTLAPLPDMLLVDAFRIPELLMAQRGVLHGDRGGVNRGQGDARPRDARSPRRGPALRLRSSQGLRHSGPPCRRCTARLFHHSPPFVQAPLAV